MRWTGTTRILAAAPAPVFFDRDPATPPADAAKGAPAGLVVSHLLDPTPTEVHVFASLSSRLPIYVVTTTNGRVWAVEGTRIRLVGPASDGAHR